MAKDEVKSILDQAADVLKANDCGHYTQPAAHLYPHQWLWDSCFTAIGLANLDIERAKMEVQSLLRGQWHNGMLPCIIFRDEAQYRTARNQWRSWVSPYAPVDLTTSGITQPPMLAQAVYSIGEKLERPERRQWYRLMYPALVSHHQWLYHDRDPHDEGLVLQIHPWETGLDNSPPWMSELHDHLMPLWIRMVEKLKLEKLVTLVRTDTKRIPVEQRSSVAESLALFDTQLRLRRKSYDIDRILDHSLFSIEDLSFNCILARANALLEEISRAIDKPLPPELTKSMKKTKKELEELWDPFSNQYYSRDFVTHRLLKTTSIATLLPIYAGIISKERAENLASLLDNPHLYGTAYPVPTVAPESVWFNRQRYWQGPTWLNMNWLIIDGLKRYGLKEQAKMLRDKTIKMVEQAGFWEYFDPISGEGLGAENFSWTAALFVDLVKSK
ncbi:MAG TPA: trehalase family glycosidase [Candidatus Sulfotelmatobacter sp.]|nr:trehalase family glycosidase [Candidatus Sulfotelmatobacter sp.]